MLYLYSFCLTAASQQFKKSHPPTRRTKNPHKRLVIEGALRLEDEDCTYTPSLSPTRGGGLGSRPKKMYGERLGDGVEYHLMSPTPRR